MAKKVFGLASVEIGDIEADGGVATSFETLGETVAGTASLTTEDNQVTDFNIEESDSPIESIVTQAGKISFAWSSYKVGSDMLSKLFGGTAVAYLAAGRILTLGSITAGSSYTNGSYTGVALTGGAGTGATANITVAGGVVTAVVIVNRGSNYAVANTLSAAAANIGGTGTGFSIPVATVGTEVDESWDAPDTFPDIEKSLQLTDRNGNVVVIPRSKISAKMSLSFAKDKLGQLDMVATVLQPEKDGTKRLSITFVQ